MKCFVVVILWVLFACTPQPNKQMIEDEIKEWWRIEEIEDVVIEDVAKQKNSMKVLARLVILTDTLERITYEFEKFEKGWKLTKEPVDRFTKALFVDGIDDLKRSKLLNNMHILQLAVEDWCTLSDGLYPSSLTAKISDVVPNSNDSSTVLSLLSTFRLINPYLRNNPPVSDALGPPSELSSDYLGKAVYFPKKSKEGRIMGYLIKGSNWDGFVYIELGN